MFCPGTFAPALVPGQRDTRTRKKIVPGQKDNGTSHPGLSRDILSLGTPIMYLHYHVNLGVSLRVLYCVVDNGYMLGRSLGDCRPALPKVQKYQMVKTQTESHVWRPVVWTNRWQIVGFFSFEVCRGTTGICHAGFWGFSEAH